MAFVQAFLNGLLVGGVYALIASGMALIFGVMRLVNFAHGAFLMVGTYLGYYGWTLLGLNPYWAFPLWGAVLFALAVGIYWLVVRRVMGASDFLQILLTEGISLALIGLAQLLFGADYRQINLPIANRITSRRARFTSAWATSSPSRVSVALVIALRQFLSHTEMGRAIRAVAQNRTVAPLMGIRVERVSAITFGLGIACAGVAGALLLPIFWTNPTVGGPVHPQVVRHRGAGRDGERAGRGAGRPPARGRRAVHRLHLGRPLRRGGGLRHLPPGAALPAPGAVRGQVHMTRLRRWWPTAVFFVALASMPLWLHDGYLLQLVFRVVVFAVLGMAWNLVGGYAGQLSLGHVAYFGIGAYAMTLSTERIGWNPWLGVVLGAVLAALAALIIGSITFRLRGPYFALSTIAAAEIIRVLVQNQDELTHGAVGANAPLLFQAPDLDTKFFLGAIPLLGAAFAFATWIHSSRFGYRLPGHPGERGHRDGGGGEPRDGQAAGAPSQRGLHRARREHLRQLLQLRRARTRCSTSRSRSRPR